MAVGTQLKSSKDLRLGIFEETNMGSSTIGSATAYEIPLISPPTIVDIKASVAESPVLQGQKSIEIDATAYDSSSEMYEISFSAICTPVVLDMMCGYLFEDNDGDNQITGQYSAPKFEHNAVMATAGYGKSACIHIGGGGYETASASVKKDIVYKGCVATSMVLNHAIDSEGGLPIVEMTFVTGYDTSYTDDMTDGDNTYTSTWGTAPNFRDWTSAGTYLSSSSAGYEIHPYSYSVSVQRNIERVGWHGGSKDPDGYIMNGAWEIIGNVTYKRDENFDNTGAKNYSGNNVMAVGNNSLWNVYVYGRTTEHSVDTGNPELRNSVTVKGARVLGSSSKILRLTM